MKVHIHLKMGDNNEIVKNTLTTFKIVFSRTISILWWRELKFLHLKNHLILKKKIMTNFLLIYVLMYHSNVQMWLLIGTVSQVSNVAHGPLVKKLLLQDIKIINPLSVHCTNFGWKWQFDRGFKEYFQKHHC